MDGTVKGEYQYYNRGFELRERGKITCFTIVGNVAWITGYVENITWNGGGYGGKFEPFDRVWRVADNGEGSNASGPDQISLIYSPVFTPVPRENPLPGTEQYCNDTPDIPNLRDIKEGNIQVHGQ